MKVGTDEGGTVIPGSYCRLYNLPVPAKELSANGHMNLNWPKLNVSVPLPGKSSWWHLLQRTYALSAPRLSLHYRWHEWHILSFIYSFNYFLHRHRQLSMNDVKNGISKSLNRAAVMSPKLGDERHRTMCFLLIISVHSSSLSVPHFLITLQLDRAAIPAAQLVWLSTPRAHSSSYSLFDVFCRHQHTPWVQESVDRVPWSDFCHLFCDKFMGPKQ